MSSKVKSFLMPTHPRLAWVSENCVNLKISPIRALSGFFWILFWVFSKINLRPRI